MLSIRQLQRAGLRPVTVGIADGDCISVSGPSGSGKTIFLRAVADLDPNTGTVLLDGEMREAMPAPHWRRLVTFVSAEAGWWADKVGAHFRDWPAALPLVERLGLPEQVRDWAVARLSTGERQRLALVRALALRPRALLLDEPTASLDPDATTKAERLVAEHLAGGACALWVTHDPGQAQRIAQRHLAVIEGRVEEGSG